MCHPKIIYNFGKHHNFESQKLTVEDFDKSIYHPIEDLKTKKQTKHT